MIELSKILQIVYFLHAGPAAQDSTSRDSAPVPPPRTRSSARAAAHAPGGTTSRRDALACPLRKTTSARHARNALLASTGSDAAETPLWMTFNACPAQTVPRSDLSCDMHIDLMRRAAGNPIIPKNACRANGSGTGATEAPILQMLRSAWTAKGACRGNTMPRAAQASRAVPAGRVPSAPSFAKRDSTYPSAAGGMLNPSATAHPSACRAAESARKGTTQPLLSAPGRDSPQAVPTACCASAPVPRR